MSTNFPISNEQVFRTIISGGEHEISMMFKNFNPFIRSRCGHYLTLYEDSGLEYYDLEVVGNAALLSAIKLYRGDNIPFAAFASVVIQNAMRNFVKQITRPTSVVARRGVSLDSYFSEVNTSLLISDAITDSELTNFGLYNPSPIGYFEDAIPFVCQKLELEILASKLEGYNYQEIRKQLNLPKRKLDELIALLKKKADENN